MGEGECLLVAREEPRRGRILCLTLGMFATEWELVSQRELVEFLAGGEPRVSVAETQEPVMEMWEFSASTRQQVLQQRNPVKVRTKALSRAGLQLDDKGEGADGSMLNSKPRLQTKTALND